MPEGENPASVLVLTVVLDIYIFMVVFHAFLLRYGSLFSFSTRKFTIFWSKLTNWQLQSMLIIEIFL